MSERLLLVVAMVVSAGLPTVLHIMRSRPAILLAVGERLTARVHYKEDHKAVLFYLCEPLGPHAAENDSVTCDIRMWVFGANDEGLLRYNHLAGCEPNINRCSHAFDNQENATGWKDFPVGENVFVVERRAEELAVWLQGHPEHQAVGFAAPGPRKLHVKPWFTYYDMPVQFSRNASDSSGGQ